MEGFIIVLQIAILFIILWTKSYIDKKGKNKADKEDIGEITEIVESIKYDISKQNELIKTQLTHKSKHDLELKNEERQAYFEFNKKMSAWLFAIVRFNFRGYSMDNFEELKLVNTKFNDLQYDYDIADGHLALFNQDIKFHEKKLELEKAILELVFHLENNIRDLYYGYKSANLRINSNPNELKIHSQEKNNIGKLHSELTKKHYEIFIPLYKNIVEIKVDLVKLIDIQLKRIENIKSEKI
jgi:hypothetical protein